MKQQWRLETPIGVLYLVAGGGRLERVTDKKQAVPMARALTGVLADAVIQLEEYFAGKRFEFRLPIAAEGTEFQKKVWAELQKIPYGKTSSYGELAKRIRNIKAMRAVGSANGKNPLWVVVPCHRVIAADGSLGGYAGGLAAKAKLLELEARITR